MQVAGEAAQGLFKYAALGKINDTQSAADRSALSVAYQTLCDDTALVGVIKQQDKATGELKEMTVNFDRKEVQEANKPFCYGGPRNLGGAGRANRSIGTN